jgi:cyanophycinase-like exopeptidase
VGIDENTALVGGIDHWVVKGKQSVWVLGKDRRIEYNSGQYLRID